MDKIIIVAHTGNRLMTSALAALESAPFSHIYIYDFEFLKLDYFILYV